jgi:hypothetical protein
MLRSKKSWLPKIAKCQRWQYDWMDGASVANIDREGVRPFQYFRLKSGPDSGPPPSTHRNSCVRQSYGGRDDKGVTFTAAAVSHTPNTSARVPNVSLPGAVIHQH